MIQRRSSLSLAAKTAECGRVTGDIFGKELQSDETVQPRVLGLVHHSHPATAEFLDHSVVRDGLSNHIFASVARDIGAESGEPS